MSAYIIDGAAVAAATLARVSEEARRLELTPGLAVVLVGSDPASQVYVGAKGKAAKLCGFHSNNSSSTASSAAATGVPNTAAIPPAAPATSSVLRSAGERWNTWAKSDPKRAFNSHWNS